MAKGFWAGSRAHVLAAIAVCSAGGVLLAALVAGAIVYFGFFNVSAQLKDAKPLEWLLITTREASIPYHAKDIVARGPATPAQIDNGFRLFKTDCAMCNSIPGGPEAMVAVGLNPPASPLSDLVDMRDNEHQRRNLGSGRVAAGLARNEI